MPRRLDFASQTAIFPVMVNARDTRLSDKQVAAINIFGSCTRSKIYLAGFCKISFLRKNRKSENKRYNNEQHLLHRIDFYFYRQS